MELDFEYQFRYALICIRFVGTSPYIPRNLSLFLRFLVLHGTFTVINCLHLYTVVKMDYDADYFTKVCPNISFIITYLYISTMYFIALKYQNHFAGMMDAMKFDFENAKQLPAEEKAVVVEYAKKGNFVTKIWTTLVVFSLVFTTLTTIVDLFKGRQEEYKFPVHIFIPGTSTEFRSDTSFGQFLVSFGLFTLNVFYLALAYAGVSPLGPIFMLHASGQLELLRIRLMQLYPEDETILYTERMTKVRSIAKKLQDIYDFVNLIKTSHKVLFELTLKGTSFIVPVLLYHVVKELGKGNYRVEFTVCLLIGSFILSCFPCYYGDILMSKSADMRDAIYMCKWEEKWEKRIRSSLLVMMTRTTRLVAIDSMFRIVCLETLTDTLKLAYTIFQALNTLM